MLSIKKLVFLNIVFIKTLRKMKFSEFSTRKKLDSKELLNLKAFFKSKCLTWEDGITCIKTECPFCDIATNKKHENVFINKTTGSFICPICQVTESYGVLSELISFAKKKTNEKLDHRIHKPKKLKITNFEDLVNVPKEVWNKMHTFSFKMPEKQLNSLRIKYNMRNHKLHFPLTNSVNEIVGERILNIDNLSDNSADQIEGKAGLLLYKSSKDDSRAILVPNMLDFFALISDKQITATILHLPYGLKSLPQEILPDLEIYRELILWFDYDVVGWDVAYNFSSKLGENRCLLIRSTTQHPTPYLALKQGLSLKSILLTAQPVVHRSITTFSTLKEDVLSELQNIEKVNGVKWKRFPTLNKLLKGHRKGELTILTGNTGCGKTTFMSEYSLDLAAQGICTLWGSFEVRNTRLASTLLRQYAGYSLENKLTEFDNWATELEKLPIYFMTFHGQQNLKVVMEAIEHAQYVYDIQHVIIDNVQFMLGISSHRQVDKFHEQDVVITAFRTFATKRNVHLTLVMHPRKEREVEELTISSIFGSAKATQEADNVLIIQDKRLTSIRGKKYLQVAKNRYTGDLGIMPLEFDPNGLSYAQKKVKNNT